MPFEFTNGTLIAEFAELGRVRAQLHDARAILLQNALRRSLLCAFGEIFAARTVRNFCCVQGELDRMIKFPLLRATIRATLCALWDWLERRTR